MANGPPHRQAFVVGLLVFAALLIDRYALLPGFEAGRGSAALAVALWLLVNLSPAAASVALDRHCDTLTGRVVARAITVLAVTAAAAAIALVWYMGDGLA